MINALQKAWKKMTPSAQALPGTPSYGPQEKELLERASILLPANSNHHDHERNQPQETAQTNARRDGGAAASPQWGQ